MLFSFSIRVSWQEEYFCANTDPDSKVSFQCCLNAQMNVNEILRWKAIFIIQTVRRWDKGQNPDRLLLPHWRHYWCVWKVYMCVLTFIKMREALLRTLFHYACVRGCTSLHRQTQIDSIITHISYTILLGENACIKVTQILVVKMHRNIWDDKLYAIEWKHLELSNIMMKTPVLCSSTNRSDYTVC